MQFTIQQIADALGAECQGDGGLTIVRAAEPGDAGPTDLAMAMSPKYAEALSKGEARAAVLWEGADWQAMGLRAAIFVKRPRMAMAGITAMLDRGQGIEPGIHPSAVIDPDRSPIWVPTSRWRRGPMRCRTPPTRSGSDCR